MESRWSQGERCACWDAARSTAGSQTPSCLTAIASPCAERSRARLLPFPWPWHAHRDTGLGGPALPNRLPAHTREKRGEERARPASQVWPFASGLPPGENAGASLDAATFADERWGAGACQGDPYHGSWEAAKPPSVDRVVCNIPFLASSSSEQVPRFFSRLGSALPSPARQALETHIFSLQNRLGAGAASHAPAQPSLAHTLPLPQ